MYCSLHCDLQLYAIQHNAHVFYGLCPWTAVLITSEQRKREKDCRLFYLTAPDRTVSNRWAINHEGGGKKDRGGLHVLRGLPPIFKLVKLPTLHNLFKNNFLVWQYASHMNYLRAYWSFDCIYLHSVILKVTELILKFLGSWKCRLNTFILRAQCT